ncbi:unnamed protein product [Diamesa serratosioi]
MKFYNLIFLLAFGAMFALYDAQVVSTNSATFKQQITAGITLIQSMSDYYASSFVKTIFDDLNLKRAVYVEFVLRLKSKSITLAQKTNITIESQTFLNDISNTLNSIIITTNPDLNDFTNQYVWYVKDVITKFENAINDAVGGINKIIDTNALANYCFAFYKYQITNEFSATATNVKSYFSNAVIARPWATYASVEAIKKTITSIETRLDYCTQTSMNSSKCLDNYIKLTGKNQLSIVQTYQPDLTKNGVQLLTNAKNDFVSYLESMLESVTSETKDLGMLLKKSLSLITTTAESKPFISLTPNELLFGYNDTLTYIAHMVYPRNLRPNKKMGLLNGAHERLSDVRTMSTGLDEHKNGYFQRVAGLKTFHVWDKSPCNDLNASDGFFFPHSDLKKKLPLFLYEEDMCRMVPLEYSKNNFHKGILTYEYVVPKGGYGGSNIGNQCYNPKSYNAPLGLQPVAPCHYGISIYISQPHFYQADPRLLDAVVGLKPSRELHQTIFKIQPVIIHNTFNPPFTNFN